LEALIDHYVAEKIGRAPRKFSLSETELRVFDRVKYMCDWRLGRPTGDMPQAEVKSMDEIIQCLKRILKSAQKWNKREGVRGYLNFASQFVR
jgi:hypothetical protein